MTWQVILMGLIPLIIFVIVDLFAGLKWGVYAAVAFAVLECVWGYVQFHEFDPSSLVAAGLIIVLGFVSIRMNSSIYFKFQPVVLDLVFAAFFAYFQFFDTPFMLKYLPKIAPLFPPEQQERLMSPFFQELFGRMSGDIVYVFLLHAILVAYVAVRHSNLVWLIVRGVMIYVLMFLMMFIDYYLVISRST